MEKKRKTNRCFDFQYTVTVQHQDGSFFYLPNAFVEEKKFGDFEMLLVYTEHCGYYAFYVDDLEHWRTLVYKRQK